MKLILLKYHDEKRCIEKDLLYLISMSHSKEGNVFNILPKPMLDMIIYYSSKNQKDQIDKILKSLNWELEMELNNLILKTPSNKRSLSSHLPYRSAIADIMEYGSFLRSDNEYEQDEVEFQNMVMKNLKEFMTERREIYGKVGKDKVIVFYQKLLEII